jgi:adenylate cyclase
MRSLRDIERCFQGVIPSYLATVSSEGVPNVTPLSIVHLLGQTRVGLSCQFMKKSLRNLQSTGRAQITVMDPVSLREYRLSLGYVGLAREGPVFERMDAKLVGIASQSGMQDVFSLAGVVECEVTAWESMDAGAPNAEASKAAIDPVERLDRVAAAIQASPDLDALLDQTFAALEEHAGLAHGFLLLTDAAAERLYTVASHGFDAARFGAEIAVGEGIYGGCAARRTAIRSGSLSRERHMSRAIAREHDRRDPTFLPLPGLEDAESTVAVPLLLGEECLGVLCFQSPEPAAFTDESERTLTIVARHLAAMIRALGVPSNAEVQLSGQRGPLGSHARVTRVKFFASDGSVFVDDQYVIKGVAGRILWHVLSAYDHEQRDEFSNKEIRLDQDIGLPALKDNLEARLIALRKRLDERDAGLRIDKAGRGKFRLNVDRALLLEHKE